MMRMMLVLLACPAAPKPPAKAGNVLSTERKAALRKRFLGDGPDHAIDLHARVWAVKGTVPQ